MVPPAILLVAAPIRLHFLTGKQRRVGGNTLKFIKLVSRRRPLLCDDWTNLGLEVGNCTFCGLATNLHYTMGYLP